MRTYTEIPVYNSKKLDGPQYLPIWELVNKLLNYRMQLRVLRNMVFMYLGEGREKSKLGSHMYVGMCVYAYPFT